jgi:hypothetical protein
MTPVSAAVPDFDDSHWPLGIIVAEAPVDQSGLHSSLTALEGWLGREEPFGLLLIAAAKPVFLSHRHCAHAETLWFRKNASLLRDKLLGVAIVAPHSRCIVPLLRPSRFKADIRFQVFDRGIEAANWLQTSIFAPMGLLINSL